MKSNFQFLAPEGTKFALMHVAFLHVGSLDVIFDSEQITKALIRLYQLAGQSELLMFVCNNEIFPLQCPYYIILIQSSLKNLDSVNVWIELSYDNMLHYTSGGIMNMLRLHCTYSLK